jgi:hypothetical protein
MSREQYWPMLVLVILAGFLGGALASRLFTIQPVFAEMETTSLRVIEAEELRIVDQAGNLRVVLKSGSREEGPHLLMYGKTGSNISLGLAHGSPALLLQSGAGRVMLGMQRQTPSLSLTYGGNRRVWTVSQGRR